MQMCADAFNMPIKTAKTTQACALGSAMIAAAAAGVYDSVTAASEAMGSNYAAIYTPDPAKHEKLEKRYQEYLRLGKHWEDFSNR